MTKTEALGVAIILLILGLAAAVNLSRSQLLARDAQRKNDLKVVQHALWEYNKIMGLFPVSDDGKVANCGNNSLSLCQWGENDLVAADDALLKPLPRDPLWAKGYAFFYRSNQRLFQLYARLENRGDDESRPEIEKLGLKCGTVICNYGVPSSEETPLTQDVTK